MARDQGPFKLDNPWPRIGWWSAGGAGRRLGRPGLRRAWAAISRTVPTLGTWNAICRASASPPIPGRRASPTAAAHADAHCLDQRHARRNRVGQRRERRLRRAQLQRLPWRARRQPIRPHPHPRRNGCGGHLQAARRLSRRASALWGVMNAIAHALSAQDSADVAAYFASRTDGLPPVAGEAFPGRAQPAAKRSRHSPGLCRRSSARHPALLRLSWPRRPQARSSGAARPARRLYRTPARGFRTGHAPKRHQRADAHDRETN